MMRSPKSFAVVCRRADGSIVVKEDEWRPLWGDFKLLRAPFLRGAVVLLESLVNGISALTFSANQQMEDEKLAEEAAEADKKPKPKPKSVGAAAAGDDSNHLATIGMVLVSLVFGLALFVGAPHLLAWAMGEVLGFDTSSFTFHAVDGVIKLAILVTYMWAISLLPDVRRVFQYHGAEHKAIFTYERGLPLTVDNARKQTRFHPRCGTSFLLIVIMVSVVLFSAVFAAFFPSELTGTKILDHLIMIGIKIPLMFPIAGLSYELIKVAGKHCDTSWWARWLSAPGMWLQKITTKEPDDQQLEIALISIRKVIWRELLGDEAGPIGEGGVDTYPSIEAIELPVHPQAQAQAA
ncbi:MAG: DUF1385 domain-containing protein [Deltaproteobacteria bacterium]|nr:DUF1385 domain-containing protein [Deltaproteobacteria bacterium]